jgi:putative Holliday junction resolvase
MRTLAIDPGTRRVGLALSDAGGKFASPFQVLQVRSPQDAVAQIVKIARDEDVDQLLVGLPLNMDGTRGPSAEEAISLANQLRAQSAKPVLLVDERLSTFAAEQSLVDRKRGGEKITRKQKKDRLDALAAADFLQAYLDGKLPPVPQD